MKLDEFYKPSEFKKTDEYKHFSAEQYFTPKDNKITSEAFNASDETPSNSKSNAHNAKNSSDKGAAENSRQKIMEFATKAGTTVATTAMAAVVSVVALSGAFVSVPTISDFSLEVQSNSVYYEFVIEDMSDELDYYVIVENPKQEFEYKIEDNNVSNTVTNLYNESAYTLSIVGESQDNLTTTTYYQTNFVTRMTEPQIQLGTPTISGINTYSVPYEINVPIADDLVYRSLTLDIVYDDGTTDTVETLSVASKGRITVESVPTQYTSMKCSAQFTYSRIGETQTTTVTSQSIERALTEEFVLLETEVGLFEFDTYYGMAHMSFAWRGHEDAYVYINNGTDETTLYYSSQAYIDVDVNGTTPTTITYDLRYDGGVDNGVNGPVYMEGGSITVNCADMPTGQIRSANPGDLSRSYNANGTVNYYMETEFECNDPDAYWKIDLYDSRDLKFTYTGRGAVAAMENLPTGDEIVGYYITESVVKEIDGIYYVIYLNNPSGNTEEGWYGSSCSADYYENDDGSYTVSVYFNNYDVEFDFDSTTLSIDGVAKKITQADLTFDEQRNRYEYSFNRNSLPASLSVNTRVAFRGETLSDQNYKVKGDLFKQVYLDIEL